MIYFNVLIEETGETFRCSPNESLLVGMERLGKKAAMAKIQFNSLRELDNWLIASLEERVRE